MNALTPGMAGGGSLGNAHGTITLDTAQLAQAAATARLLGRQMENALQGVGNQAKQTESGLMRVGKGLREIRGEALAVSAALTLATAKGFQLAGGLQETQILMKGITGSAKAAADQIERGREAASRYGRPLGEVLSIYTKLSPILKANADSLDRAVALAARLKVLNPQEDAAFAIREFLSGDPLSLIERFNIPRSEVRGLANEFGYTLATLEMLMDRMNISNELAEEMGESFNSGARRAADALGQLVATGFTPLLNQITPVIQGTADWLAEINRANPAILSWGAGLLVVATSGGVLLTVLAQILDTSIKLQQLGVFSQLGNVLRGGAGVASRLALPAAIVGAGIVGGNQLTRLEGRLTGDEGKANRTIGQDFEILKRNIFNLVKGWNEGMAQIRTSTANATAGWIEGLGQMLIAMGQFQAGIMALIPGGGLLGGNAGATANLIGEGLVGVAGGIRGAAAAQNRQDRMEQNRLARWMGIGNAGSDGAGEDAIRADAARRAEIEAQLSNERRQILQRLGRDLERLERETGERREDAVEDAAQARLDTIEQYNQTLARDEEDFQISRARAEQNLQDSINRVIQDSARQRRRMEEDLAESMGRAREDAARRAEEAEKDRDERIADIRKTSAERITEIEKKGQEDREKAAEDYRLRILDAAANLDAVTLFREQERNRKESQERAQGIADAITKEREKATESVNEIDKAFDKRRAAEQENLDRQLEDMRAGHEKQLALMAENDALRIEDMKRAHEEQKRVEDEDRALRLQRMADDHQDQLDDIGEALADQLEAINEAYADQYQAIYDAHNDQLEELGDYHRAWDEKQAQWYEDGLKAHEQFLKDLSDLYPYGSHPSEADPYGDRPPPATQPPFMGGNARGGYVDRNRAAYLHAGEQVLSASTVDTLRLMLGGGFSQGDLAGAVTAGVMGGGSGGGSSSFTVAQGAIVIHAQPGQDEARLAAMVEARLRDLYERFLRGRQ